MSSAFGGSKTKTTDTTPQYFKDLREPTRNVFQALLGERTDVKPLAGIPTSPQSQTGYTAPLGANEQQLLAGLMGEGGARNALLNDTLAGKYTDPNSNPFLRDYINAAQRETANTYERVLGRTLPGQFTQAGHSVQPGGSSPFAMAAAVQSEGFANALKDISTNIGFNAYEQERGRQQQAIGLSQAEVDTSIKNLQAQALPRMIEQLGIDKGLEEFQNRSNQLLQVLSMLMGGQLQQQGTKSTTSPNIFNSLFPGGAPQIASGIGGAMAGGAPAGGTA